MPLTKGCRRWVKARANRRRRFSNVVDALINAHFMASSLATGDDMGTRGTPLSTPMPPWPGNSIAASGLSQSSVPSDGATWRTALERPFVEEAGESAGGRCIILGIVLPKYPPNLSALSESGLFALYRAILRELKSRGVIRTENAPMGDYAEYLVAAALGGQLAPNSEKAWDVLGSDGEKLQVKARVVSNAAEPGSCSCLRLGRSASTPR